MSQAALTQETAIKIDSAKSKFEYQLNFATKTAGFYEGEDSASQVLFGFNPHFNFNFHKNFWIDANLSMNLNSSRVQTRYINRNDENFVLNELAINFQPTKYTLFKLGAINQGHLDSPMLISAISFPGAMANLEANSDRSTFGIKAQRLIPTSTSFDSERTSKEALPLFQTAGVYGKAKLLNFIDIDGQINYYEFNKLPSVVAFESRRLGNDVSGIEIGDSRFLNNFSGLSQTANIKLNFHSKIEQFFKVAIVENENTADGDNRAQLLETGLILKLANFNLIPSIATFYAEPNVAPAFYNSSLFGNTNRQGNKYALRAEMKSIKLNVEVGYIDAKTINTSVFQDDLSSLQLLMEMVDVKF